MGLLDVSVHEICRLGSGPDREGLNSNRRPNAYVKQKCVYDGHHKYHGLSALTVSYPNSMSAVIGVVSARHHDSKILTWSEVDQFLFNIQESTNSSNYAFYSDKGFLGQWRCICCPHSGSHIFPLNRRQIKENEIMKKLRIRIEWAYSILKMSWKLTIKFLFLKLDQNKDLCLQHIRLCHLLSNFKCCYRGNSLSDVVLFCELLSSIDDYVSYVI